MAETGRTRLKTALAAAILIAAVAVYWPVTGFEFVSYDDDLYVTENPWVSRGVTGSGLAWAFTGLGYAGNWHPLTWISHMVDVQLYGLIPRGHHLTNLLLHLADTVLLFMLLSGMTGALWRSALAAALFALHPLHVESVAWVAERKDVLAALFWLLTTGVYLEYVHRPRVWRYLVLVFSFSLALMAKPMAATLPITLLILDYWPLGRRRSAAGGGTGGCSVRPS